MLCAERREARDDSKACTTPLSMYRTQDRPPRYPLLPNPQYEPHLQDPAVRLPQPLRKQAAPSTSIASSFTLTIPTLAVTATSTTAATSGPSSATPVVVEVFTASIVVVVMLRCVFSAVSALLVLVF
ncbi:hypothetical protein BU25DRAFT_218879 [Macroventuria anomochaeta]|uniref:Uncharacterized protein n=1 Tax=Macroventuria anomochaeta TaxID=301207 RepID=A0ACB6RJL1_9PLEO|nr:uncharacterized protein BU25DRAFT_218879 [Macroventuria anomochaeta]KAF2622091.1 hypothetical protein BU25DRAFT_218879 [Macroventuria anomochaeta]